MIVLVPALAGALVVGGLIALVVGLRPSPVVERPSRPRQVRTIAKQTRMLLLGGFAAGVVAFLVTGWVLALLVVPAAFVGLPILLSSSSAAQRIERLEAMEEWTRSLAGVLTVGVGLEQALVATLRSTPAAISPEVTRLVARLRARWVTEDALRAFADELDDATGDLVAANLILGARRRGAGLASVLEGLAESVAADVRARRQVEADRAKPRATARWVTLISVGVLVILAVSGTYVKPYQSPLRAGHPRRTAGDVRRHPDLDEAHGDRTGNAPVPLDRSPDEGGRSMTTGLQVALLGGAFLGLGVVLLIARLMPAEADLAEALTRLTPTRGRANTISSGGPVTAATGKERIGVWAIKALPPAIWIRTPTRELALLRIPLARFYGDKIVMALMGLVIPPLLAWFFGLIGLGFPVAIPAIASVGLATMMFFLPNYNAVDDARKARLEFTRALGAYIDLVALERNNGSGVRQAMEAAAEVGDSWVFTRLSEELTRSRWSGQPPWDALHALADELGLPELDDFADIMRLSGEEGASVYTNLRARSAAMRTAMLNDEIAEANAVGERMTIPGSLLGVIFMALLVAPSLLRMFSNT
ncbi:MAG: type II secretion system F family protein [Marmoricola sp.]